MRKYVVFSFLKSAKARAVEAMNVPSDQAWVSACAAWHQAKAVYDGLVGYGAEAKYEYCLLMAFIHSHRSSAADYLRQGAMSPDPMIAAYSVIGLGLIDRNALRALQNELSDRKELVVWKGGCFAGRLPIAELVAMHSAPWDPRKR